MMRKNGKWANLSLSQYVRLVDVIQGNYASEEDRVLDMVRVVFNVNPYTVDMYDFKRFIKELDFISDEIPNMKIQDEYTLNGSKYTLCKKIQNINVAQFIDWQNHCKDGDIRNAHKLLSVFLVPTGMEYGEGYDVENVQNDIWSYMSIADVNSLLAFFLTLSKAYTAAFLQSSLRTISKDKTMKKETRKRLKKARRRMIMEILGVLRRS